MNIKAVSTLLLAVVVAVLSANVARAQSFDEPVLHYDMALRTPADKMENLGFGNNAGTLHNFGDLSSIIGAYGEEDSGATTFVSFNGSQHISTDQQQQAPREFRIEIEFRTDTPVGKLIGFEDQNVGFGILNDRLLYIGSDGHLRFGGGSGTEVVIESQEPVTDGQWHTAVATGLVQGFELQYDLFIDGALHGVGTGRSVNSYPGYWRIGLGNMGGWPESGTITDGFVGDIRSVKIFDLSGAEPQPTPTPAAPPPSLGAFVPVEPGLAPILHLDPSMQVATPDGITGIEDVSGNDNDATFFFVDDPEASLIRESGDTPVKQFVRFDGVDDVLGTDNSSNAPEDMTLSVWFRTSSPGGKIAGFENNIAFGSTEADRHLYVDNDGFLRFGGHDDTLNNLVTWVSQERVDDGEWHNVVLTLETSGDSTFLALYLDGELASFGRSNRLIQYQGFWRLGGGNLDNWPEVTNGFLNGDIGPLRVYDRALTMSQLAWLALPPEQESIDDALELWLDAEDMQGAATIMFDLSGNGVFGALNNFEDPEGSFVEQSHPAVSRSLRFDGFDDLVTTDTLLLAPDEFTMAVWFRTSEAGGTLVALDDATPGAESETNDRIMYVDSNGLLRFGMRNDFFVNVQSNSRVNDGAWHFAVGTVEWTGVEYVMRLYVDGQDNGSTTTTLPFRQYNGFWLIGNGTLAGWPGASAEAFGGDFGSLRIYERALTEEEATSLFESFTASTPQPTPTPFFEPDFPHEFEEIDITPKVDVSSDVDGDSLTLNISIRNVELFDSDVWIIREEDGEEFLVGSAQSSMTWEGEAATSRFTVEVRRQVFGEPGEEEETEVLASGSVPIFHQPASTTEVVAAVAVTVAVVGTVSAASASGTWIYELIWRFLRIFFAERLRRRTKNFDISSIPSWIAATVAILLMALLIAIARPGALELNNFLVALTVSIPAVILFRLVTILGGFALAYYTNQKPRYLIWAAGTVSFAITSLILQSPIGYTGYMERDPSDKERDARFAAAGFAAVLALSGLFVMIGLVTKMSFAEVGVTLTLGVLAVMMLPFPLMAGNAIWKWNKSVGVASGIIGMTPYILFQLGHLGPTAVVTLATFGLLAFIGFLIGELWLAERERMRVATAAAEASAEGSSAV